MDSVANEPLVIGQLQHSGGIMWKLRALILLPILLFACRPINGNSPEGTAVPDNNDSDMSSALAAIDDGCTTDRHNPAAYLDAASHRKQSAFATNFKHGDRFRSDCGSGNGRAFL